MSYQAPEFLTRRPGPFIVCRLRPALAMTGGTVGADVSEIRALGIKQQFQPATSAPAAANLASSLPRSHIERDTDGGLSGWTSTCSSSVAAQPACGVRGFPPGMA